MMKFWKKKLGRPLVLAGLAASFASAIGPNAQADFYVRTARIETSTGGATSIGSMATNGGVNKVNGNTSDGNQFINNYTGNMFGTAGSVRVVGSNLLSRYTFQNQTGRGALYNPSPTPAQPIVAVFALDGTTAGGTGISIFKALTGRLGLFSIAGTSDVNGFDATDPITWGATNSSGSALLTPIAVWDLKLPEPVFDSGIDPDKMPPYNVNGGGPGIFNLATSQVNQIAVNSAVGSANQGFFLFRETVDDKFSTTAGALSGNSYATVIGNPPIIPPGTIFQDEGLVSRIDESIVGTPAAGSISGGPGTAGFDALNTIAKMLGGLIDLGGSGGVGTAFATGFGGVGNSGGTASDFNPSNGMTLPNTADLFLTLGTTSSPGVQVTPIPEPASVTMLLCGGLAAAGVVGIRRFRVKQAVVC